MFKSCLKVWEVGLCYTLSNFRQEAQAVLLPTCLVDSPWSWQSPCRRGSRSRRREARGRGGGGRSVWGGPPWCQSHTHNTWASSSARDVSSTELFLPTVSCKKLGSFYKSLIKKMSRSYNMHSNYKQEIWFRVGGWKVFFLLHIN